MTRLEMENYLLTLNEGQRLALLLALAKHVRKTGIIYLEEFEWKLTVYSIEKRKRERG